MIILRVLAAFFSVLVFTAGAIIMTGCVTIADFEVGLGTVDDPTSDDPSDFGWGIIIRPTGSNEDFEDTNEEDGNICMTCRGDFQPIVPMNTNDPYSEGGCLDTFWGCEDYGKLQFASSYPMNLEGSSGSGRIWIYDGTGAYMSSQDRAWQSTGTSVEPTNKESLSGMIDYNLAMGNVIVYEALVPMNVYAPTNALAFTSGSFVFDNSVLTSEFRLYTSDGSACNETPPGSLPATAMQTCGLAP